MPDLGGMPMRIISTYRTRAVGFETLAKRTRDASLKHRLYDLARACSALAEAIERNEENITAATLDKLPKALAVKPLELLREK